MQRQLDKITELVQLVVQKMEINTQMVTDDRSQCDDLDNCGKMQHFRKTLNAMRLIPRLRRSTSNRVSNSTGYINV
jgi:hypothetical protein